jgi:hypothetical protein
MIRHPNAQLAVAAQLALHQEPRSVAHTIGQRDGGEHGLGRRLHRRRTPQVELHGAGP